MSDIEAARDELACSLGLLTKSLDAKPETYEISDEEMKTVRQARATRMYQAASRLYNLVMERRTR